MTEATIVQNLVVIMGIPCTQVRKVDVIIYRQEVIKNTSIKVIAVVVTKILYL